MPNPTKKTFVKVAKKTAEPKIEIEASVPKGLTKEFIAKVNETTDINTKRREVEGVAKNDSIAGAKAAKFNGKDIVDQGRTGNKAANETRLKGGVPQVMRGREYVNNSELTDKYSTGTSTSTRDSYSRTGNLEKEMPSVKKIMVKVNKKA